jgi:hypothetical protein
VTETRSIGEILRDSEAGRLENILAEDREPYDLIGAADRLFQLLDERHVDYVLVGGIAMLQYVDGRNTRDVDLIMSAGDLAGAPELAIASQDQDFARAAFEGIQVDLLLTTNQLFLGVQDHHATIVEFGGRQIRCATPSGLLLLKLFALPSLYRQGESIRAAIYEADVAGLLPLVTDGLPAIFAELRPHLLATDSVELKELVSDIRNRGKRFKNQPPSGGCA